MPENVNNQGRVWTLAAYLQRFRADRALREVVVEGDSDQSAIKNFLSDVSTTHFPSIVPVRCIEIPDQIALRHGYAVDSGNRSRVLVLAAEAKEYLKDGHGRLLCLIDSDMDILLNRSHARPVICTDFHDLESYALDPEVVSRHFSYTYNLDRGQCRGILDILFPILIRLRLARASSHILSMGLSFPDPGDYLAVKGGALNYDELELFRRYLSSLPEEKRLQFHKKMLELDGFRLDRDARCFVRSHDCADVLRWYLLKVLKVAAQDIPVRAEPLLRALLGYLSSETVFDFPLFREIRRHFDEV